MENLVIDPSCLSLFTVVLPKSTTIYKGFKDQTIFNHQSTEPCWFAFDRQNARKYGAHVISLKTHRPLRLLNLNSILFKFHFTDQVNITIVDKDVRESVLFPLGIPDIIECQQLLINRNVPEHARHQNICASNAKLRHDVKYYGNTSRYSGFTLDQNMVDAMIKIYGKHVDGYVQLIDSPSCWHRTFPREVCIFNPKKHVFTQVTQGGAIPNKKSRIPKPKPLTKEDMKKYPNAIHFEFRTTQDYIPPEKRKPWVKQTLS